MQSLISPKTQRVMRKTPRAVVARQVRMTSTSDHAPMSIYQTCRRVARLSKRFAYFFLPPVMYSGIKLLMPRIVQPQVRQQLHATLERRLRPQPIQNEPLLEADNEPLVPSRALPQEPLASYRALHQMSENSASLLEAKFDRAAELYRGQLYDRARLLREMGRLATLRGKELLGCAYQVRAIRLLGADVYHDLPFLKRTLERLHFAAEAEALSAMYEDPRTAPDRCQRLLENALAAHKQPPAPVTFSRWEDRRHAEVPRVAVIVSLYNAAARLPLFLHAIRSQSLLEDRQLELILVDSGSPADEYGALTQTLATIDLPYLYVRTANRETIQTAWNRGIALARAPYLSFLGVDEAVTPDALALLADALDSDPALDWVTGDSLLTEVDEKGSWTRDVMTYNRDGYTANHVYLETCYLSWVGALYRRSIHDRFGYYDGSFRATGDNEFKCRVLPFIKTKRIPHLLGLFVNYPEPRATASPVAELEDLRAWYVNKTLGGIRYAMQNRDSCEVEKLLLLALGYRKSYTTHQSSDIEYAAAVAAHLAERLPSSPLMALVPGIHRLLEAVRGHDHPRPLTPLGFERSLVAARDTFASVQTEHRSAPWIKKVEYRIHRDNRHEQHAFLY